MQEREILILTKQDKKLIIRAISKSIGVLRKKPVHKDLLTDYERIREKILKSDQS